MNLLQRLGGGAQLLRGVLGIAFPFLLALMPADNSYTAPLVGGGVLAYIAARWLVLAEPTTLLDMGEGSAGHIGEAVFLSIALSIALIVLAESGWLNVGPAAGVLIVIAYLFLHALLLPLLAGLLMKRSEGRAERPNLRRFIRGAAFIAGQTIVVMMMGLAMHKHGLARSGPWGLWDVVPGFEMVLLVVGYMPIAWLEMAATKQRRSRKEERDGLFEATVLQGAAILVCALTGHAPWL